MIGITHLMMPDSMLSNFPIYHTSDVILGHIFFSILTLLFDGVILGLIDSHTIVLVEHMLNFLDILIGVFSSQPPTCSHSSSLVEYFLANDKLTNFHHPQ